MNNSIKILAVANGLISDNGDNEEYDRAIVEMTTELLGVSMEDKVTIAIIIGVKGKSLENVR